MKINKSIVLCACAAVLTAACAAKNENVAAIVNGTKISQKMYEGTVNNLVSQQKQANPNFADNEQTRLALGRAALEELITNEVLAQEAAKAHIAADDAAVKQTIENLKQRLAVKDGQRVTDAAEIDKIFKEKLAEDGITLKELQNNIRKELNAKLFLNDLSSKQKAELSEDVLHRFYNGTMAVVGNDKAKVAALDKADLALILPFAVEVKKATAPRASVSAVFLATPATLSKEALAKKKDEAKKIAQELKDKKVTFVEAIEKYSDDKNALRTNGEQVVMRGTLPESLDKKVFEAALGKVEGPLTEKDGLYILRVNERRAETPVSYDQLRGDMIKYLAALQLKQKLQQQVKSLVAGAKVEILLPQYQLADAQPAAK